MELKAKDGVCFSCLSDIAPVNADGCRFCGRPQTSSSGRCKNCINRHSDIDEFYTAFYYEGPIKNLIKKYKYDNALYLERFLSGYLVNLFKSRISDHFEEGFIVPLPLHKSKLKKRGFNQSQNLASRLSERVGVKTAPRFLKRVRNTSPQYTCKRRERFKNIEGAFKASPKCAGHNIILIDDISTTGATIQQAAMVLKKCGAEKITAVTIAHGR